MTSGKISGENAAVTLRDDVSRTEMQFVSEMMLKSEVCLIE